MAESLPSVPRIVFTVLEPISLVAGFIGTVADPDWFLAEQIPSEEPLTPSINSRLVVLQLGNLYLLLCMVGLAVLSSTSEIKVIRNYLVALWIADIGHIAFTWHALGHGSFVDVAGWNAMTWGNVGATGALFLTRSAYFLGAFGPDRNKLPSKKTL